jgi:hypothetical protein
LWFARECVFAVLALSAGIAGSLRAANIRIRCPARNGILGDGSNRGLTHLCSGRCDVSDARYTTWLLSLWWENTCLSLDATRLLSLRWENAGFSLHSTRLLSLGRENTGNATDAAWLLSIRREDARNTANAMRLLLCRREDAGYWCDAMRLLSQRREDAGYGLHTMRFSSERRKHSGNDGLRLINRVGGQTKASLHNNRDEEELEQLTKHDDDEWRMEGQ